MRVGEPTATLAIYIIKEIIKYMFSFAIEPYAYSQTIWIFNKLNDKSFSVLIGEVDPLSNV